MRVLVTGGTGDLGSRLVPRLEKAGHDVVVGTRRPSLRSHMKYTLDSTPDLRGFDVVVHLASDPLHPQVDVEGSAALWKAAREAGVGHVVFMSIVGIDEHPYPYYRAKRAIEEQLEGSDLPYTILRATQFHGLIPTFVNELSRRLGFVPVPKGISIQPIDADVVADRLAEIVDAGPSGRVGDLAGPEVLRLEDMARDYMRAAGVRRLRVRMPIWGPIAEAFRHGLQLAPGVDSGGETYADYLLRVPRGRPDGLATAMRLIAFSLLVTMGWMIVAPDGFHRLIAGFGELNTHYVRDAATFMLPLVVALWLAASRPTWRGPVLVLALVQNGAHLINHIIDVGNTDPAWQGPVNLALLAALQVALWVVFRRVRSPKTEVA